MTSCRPFFTRVLAQGRPLAVLLLGACSDGGAKATATGAMRADASPASPSMCAGRDTTALRVAVLDYITTANPRPQRFLSAFGTDSALPEDGFKSLQDKGPTYYYNDNPKNQAQVRAKLHEAGPYTTMLVVYKGNKEADHGNTVTVTLGGHYVGGDFEGRVAPVRDITVRCDSTGWRLPSSATKPAGAAAPPAAAPGA
jgi:hypothetical protein